MLRIGTSPIRRALWRIGTKPPRANSGIASALASTGRRRIRWARMRFECHVQRGAGVAAFGIRRDLQVSDVAIVLEIGDAQRCTDGASARPHSLQHCTRSAALTSWPSLRPGLRIRARPV
ncbi:hypothetical protein [Xanthomonas sp. XNM01]|uniref:hypothetical protein n=1 Tax=Xanthomonas sp. XNM01 TaxID=2769289 RepID=UPI001784BA1A|nr:hypothetical protein [Xanthomonas sp. XNM01]MBD9367199.1 hypothetical protein [Xanthomonas sp. XNM01]